MTKYTSTYDVFMMLNDGTDRSSIVGATGAADAIKYLTGKYSCKLIQLIDIRTNAKLTWRATDKKRTWRA